MSAGLTKGYLSKIEHDRARPSVAALLRLCEALNLSYTDLFEDRSGDLVRASEYLDIDFGGEGLQERLLTPRMERRLQVIYSRINPGAGSGKESYSLPVEVEMAFVLEGELNIDIDGELHQLRQGDALTFAGPVRHQFFNPHPTADACVLWILIPSLLADRPDTGEGVSQAAADANRTR